MTNPYQDCINSATQTGFGFVLSEKPQHQFCGRPEAFVPVAAVETLLLFLLSGQILLYSHSESMVINTSSSVNHL